MSSLPLYNSLMATHTCSNCGHKDVKQQTMISNKNNNKNKNRNTSGDAPTPMMHHRMSWTRRWFLKNWATPRKKKRNATPPPNVN